MTEYDRERQNEIDEIWEREAAEVRLAMTDEQVRALGGTEIAPGYFRNDPRHPNLDPKERYVLDHPLRQDWVERRGEKPRPRQPLPPRKAPRWDDEQFSGETFDFTQPQPLSALTQSLPASVRTTYGLWLCQICRHEQAQWPREISWQRMIWGLRVSVVVRSPYACTQCRVMRFNEQQPLGHLDHRPFWVKVIRFFERWRP